MIFLSVLLLEDSEQILKRSIFPFFAKRIIAIETKICDKINFVEGKLENFDAVIATGSTNGTLF
jgi:hypothetical protein